MDRLRQLPLSIPRFRRDVNLLLAVTGLLAISFFGIQMLLKVLYVLRLGYGPAYLGLFNAAGAVGYMAMSLPSGVLGNRWGVTRVMLVGTMVTTLGMAMLPMTESLPIWARQAWPILSQLVVSGGYAMFSINLVPALMAVTSAQNRTSAYAMSSVLRNMGTFLGTIGGGLLPGWFALMMNQSVDSTAPYRLALGLGAALGLMALVPLSRIRDAETASVEEAPNLVPRAFPMLPVGLLVIYVGLSQAASATCQSFCSAYMDTELHLSTAAIGYLTGSGQFVAIFVPMIGPRLARRYGNGWTLLIATVGSAVSILPLIFFPHWIGAGMGRLGTLAVAGLWMPALQVYQMELVSRQWRSLAYGVVSMAMGLSFGVVSYLGGNVVAGWGYPMLYWMGLILSVIGASLMWGMLRRPTLMATAGEATG